MAAKHLLYLIGQPGSGKSTLAAGLVEGLEPLSVETRPFAHTIWPGGVAELGARREAFSGTDALSMSVQPKVVEWLEFEAPDLILGEGDRLANGKFFTSARAAGWNLLIVRLAVSSSIAAARRAERATALGVAPQSPSWLQGRITKAARLAEEWDEFVFELDADAPPAHLLAQLVGSGHPVAQVLASQRCI